MKIRDYLSPAKQREKKISTERPHTHRHTYTRLVLGHNDTTHVCSPWFNRVKLSVLMPDEVLRGEAQIQRGTEAV